MFEANKDKKKALEYIQKGQQPGSKILDPADRVAGIGRPLVANPMRSLQQSAASNWLKTAENDDYIRMNEKSIAEWTKK
jgi:hypothetical protein